MTFEPEAGSPWRSLKRVFRLPFSRSRLDSDVDDEIAFHIDGRIDDLMVNEGLSRAEAEREARRRFGDLAHYRREARDIDQSTYERTHRMELRETFTRETRRAARTLLRSPSFTIITLVTLALGIGAATAIFTLLDAVVLRPLPYPNADRLVQLSSPVPLLKGQTEWGLARHEMFYFLEQGHTLENLAVYQLSDATVLGTADGERPERVRWAQVSASIFDVLGFTPVLGRPLLSEDNHAELPTVVVLGHGFWTRRYGADPGIIGKAINVEGFPMTVVGVMPEGANLPDLTVELWAPAHVDSTTNWNNHTWSAIGRLKPGVTAADAQRDLAPLTARLPEVFPSVYRPTFVTSTGFTTKVVSLRDAVVGDIVTRALWTLFGAVGLVLLIGAANVANLFLVRLDSRRREVALRTALGAGTRHLAWHYFAESLLIAFISAIGAIALAQAMLSLLLAIAPSELPRLAEVGLSGTSIAFAFGCALLAGLVFGLLPLTGARLDNTILREGGRGLTTSRRGLMARRVLVAAQMAFAVVLLVSAMLMVQTFRNLRAVDAGFDPRGVMTAQISLPALRYNGEPDLASNFYEQLAGRLRELPGVELVGFTDHLPMLSGDLCNGVTLEGPTPESATGTCPPAWLVSPDYFEAMGIRVEGRTLDWSGMNAHDGGMVVSKAFAEHHWPNESAIGKGIKFNSSKPPFYRVVGVAEDVRGLGVNEPPIEVIYFPMRPIPDAPLWGAPTGMNVMIRSSLSRPIELAGALRRIVQELDPQVAVANERSMEAIVAASMAKHSFTMVLLVIAGGIAIVLSAVGIYGVISYIVTERRGEIGVRMALGARVEQVTRLVLRQSLGLAIIGVVIGVLAAVATTRLMRALLFGVGASDPLTMVAVPLLLLAVTVLASYAPARRAARIDPAEVMRSE